MSVSRTPMPLVQAGMGVIRSGPSTAEKFGEDSLKLGFSSPLESLLLHLYISNRSEGEKLFSHILAVAKSRNDYNLFSMIGNQAFNGPFTTDKYKRQLVGALAGAILEMERSGTTAPRSAIRGHSCHRCWLTSTGPYRSSLLSSARKDLEKADSLQQAHWYLAHMQRLRLMLRWKFSHRQSQRLTKHRKNRKRNVPLLRVILQFSAIRCC